MDQIMKRGEEKLATMGLPKRHGRCTRRCMLIDPYNNSVAVAAARSYLVVVGWFKKNGRYLFHLRLCVRLTRGEEPMMALLLCQKYPTI